MTGPVVRDAPYSAEATSTVTQTLGDGTRIEQSTTAKYDRDSRGRIRREQTIIALGGLNASREPQSVITVDPDPDDAVASRLDPASRTARQVGRGAGAIGGINQFFLNTVVMWNATPDSRGVNGRSEAAGHPRGRPAPIIRTPITSPAICRRAADAARPQGACRWKHTRKSSGS
jgi:hypothetical protein